MAFHLCVCMTWGLSLQYIAVKGSNQMGAKLWNSKSNHKDWCRTIVEAVWKLLEYFQNGIYFFNHHWDCLGCEIFSLYLQNMAIKKVKNNKTKQIHSSCISTMLAPWHSCTLFASFSDSPGGRVKHFGKCILPTTVILSGLGPRLDFGWLTWYFRMSTL